MSTAFLSAEREFAINCAISYGLDRDDAEDVFGNLYVRVAKNGSEIREYAGIKSAMIRCAIDFKRNKRSKFNHISFNEFTSFDKDKPIDRLEFLRDDQYKNLDFMIEIGRYIDGLKSDLDRNVVIGILEGSGYREAVEGTGYEASAGYRRRRKHIEELRRIFEGWYPA